MASIQVPLTPGYIKADANSIPTIQSDTIFAFISKLSKDEKSTGTTSGVGSDLDLNVDFVQLKNEEDDCIVKAFVFPVHIPFVSDITSFVMVSVTVNVKNNEIKKTSCAKCSNKESCRHILAFIFWLHRKSTESGSAAVGYFWGSESESQLSVCLSESMRIRDLFICDEVRFRSDLLISSVNESEGKAFLEAILDEMSTINLKDTTFYKYFRPSKTEFDDVFIHHAMLQTMGKILDPQKFILKMEEIGKSDIYERLAEATKKCYKAPIWLEIQFMRIRCSMFHRIATRRDESDTEAILDSMFGNNRKHSSDEKHKIKFHKHFILRQTEMLEGKTYKECGILIHESFPYICAMPDGITDDHIVEIKVPTNDEEFEAYLECQESISPKYMAQIQIQMFVANVSKALYCVLSPAFETSGALHYVWVQADMEFVANLIATAEEFWKEVVYPYMYKSYFQKDIK